LLRQDVKPLKKREIKKQDRKIDLPYYREPSDRELLTNVLKGIDFKSKKKDADYIQ